VRWCVQAVPSADCLGGGVAGGRQHAVGAVPGGFAGDGLVQGPERGGELMFGPRGA
jgi:hypothetical protein